MNGIYLKRKSTFVSAVFGTCMTLGSAAFADDTEIYFSQANTNSNIASNVLFVLDNSGSMEEVDDNETRRIDKMRTALLDVLGNTNNVNIGIGTFNGSDQGGGISYPVSHIDKDLCPDATCASVDAYAFMESGFDDADELNEAPQSVDTTADYISLGNIHDKAGKPGTTGLRFAGLNVPRGAAILSATIEFDSALPESITTNLILEEEVTNGAANFTVTGEATGDALPYKDTAQSITGRTPTSASVNWIPGNWGKYPYRIKSDDFSPIVEEIVGRTDWCGGNALAFQISGTGTRIGKAWDLYKHSAPKLRVTYDPSTINFDDTCLTKTTVSNVGSGNDDALEDSASGSVNVSGLNINLLLNSNPQINGYRFLNIDIPQGAIITDAYLELQASQDGSGPVDLRIEAHAIDHSLPFGSAAGAISGTTPTAATTIWSAVPDTTVDQRLKSPPLTTIVQELINRPGWANGNAINLVTTALAGANNRSFYSYESSPAASARLHVEYQLASSSTDIPSFYTTRDKLSQIVSDFHGYERTPLLDAYLEGVHYLMGKPVLFGKKRGDQSNINRFYRLSHEDSYTNGNINRPPTCTADDLNNVSCVSETIVGSPVYNTPIETACQSNQLILLSDGSPNENHIETPASSLMGGTACASLGDETCGRELATWLASNDVAPHIPGDQFITTSTVGFHFSGSILSDMASNGGGSFFEAESATELTRAFQDIFNGFADVDASFVSPSISVNQVNRLTNREDVYFALFKPNNKPYWTGNLKRYKLAVPTGDTTGKVQILDMDNKVAIDEATGLFKPTAKSFWSATDDGAAVGEGGAASNLTQFRSIYTYLENDVTSQSIYVDDAAQVTKEILGIVGETDQHHTDLLSWVTGKDVKDIDEDNDTTDGRMQLGDPMHSTPMVMNYSVGNASSVVFFGTNEGILHAVNTETGAELSGIIPPQLLPQLNLLYNNRADTPHLYGLDGPITAWIENDNGNLIVDAGETAYLSIGMRRGGQHYYTFNITDPTEPKLAWDISPARIGFEDIGQTWSTPIQTLVNVSGTMKPALIFAGGYDTSNDSKAERGPDIMGNAIYVVDASDGSLIWSYTYLDNNAMQYSIPSDIRVIDLDLDGAADRAYVGDTGGQIWRFDFNNRSDGTGFSATAGVIADLNDGTIAGNRRFFYEPDVALVNEEGSDFLAISIGSGWRAHPLDTNVSDRFFSLRDYAVFGPLKNEAGAATYITLEESDLVDATVYDATTTEVVTDGWFIELDRAGEKVLADAITINNQIIFTSYHPENNVMDCSSAVGFGSLYVVDVFNAAPTLNLDDEAGGSGDDILTESDRHTQLDRSGIPPKPAAVFPDGAKPTVLVGPEQKLPDLDFGPLTTKTYWAEQLEE